MLKYSLLPFILLLISCSENDSGDNNLNSCQELNDFIEPPIDFTLTKQQIKDEFGQPRQESFNSLFYDGFNDAEDTRKYSFLGGSNYLSTEVFICNSLENYEFLVNTTQNNYGIPLYTEDDLIESPPNYLFSQWNVDDLDLIIQIAYNPASDFIIVVYINNT
jgi:hypothetical protein